MTDHDFGSVSDSTCARRRVSLDSGILLSINCTRNDTSESEYKWRTFGAPRPKVQPLREWRIVQLAFFVRKQTSVTISPEFMKSEVAAPWYAASVRTSRVIASLWKKKWRCYFGFSSRLRWRSMVWTEYRQKRNPVDVECIHVEYSSSVKTEKTGVRLRLKTSI